MMKAIAYELDPTLAAPRAPEIVADFVIGRDRPEGQLWSVMVVRERSLVTISYSIHLACEGRLADRVHVFRSLERAEKFARMVALETAADGGFDPINRLAS